MSLPFPKPDITPEQITATQQNMAQAKQAIAQALEFLPAVSTRGDLFPDQLSAWNDLAGGRHLVEKATLGAQVTLVTCKIATMLDHLGRERNIAAFPAELRDDREQQEQRKAAAIRQLCVAGIDLVQCWPRSLPTSLAARDLFQARLEALDRAAQGAAVAHPADRRRRGAVQPLGQGQLF